MGRRGAPDAALHPRRELVGGEEPVADRVLSAAHGLGGPAVRSGGVVPESRRASVQLGGGGFVGPFQLSMFTPAGAVYYTTDGHDPRLPGGMVAPEARLYGGPITIATSQQVRARAWRTNTWSALAAADFTASPVAPSLTIRVSGSVIETPWPPQAGGFVLETARSRRAGVDRGPRRGRKPGCGQRGEAGSRFYRLRHSP